MAWDGEKHINDLVQAHEEEVAKAKARVSVKVVGIDTKEATALEAALENAWAAGIVEGKRLTVATAFDSDGDMGVLLFFEEEAVSET